MGFERLRVARSAYIIYLTTPPAERAPELRKLEDFCKHMKVSLQEVAAFESEPGFDDEIMRSDSYWKRGVHAVIAAIKQRAESPAEKDQLRYAAAYLELVGHDGAERLRHLLPE